MEVSYNDFKSTAEKNNQQNKLEQKKQAKKKEGAYRIQELLTHKYFVQHNFQISRSVLNDLRAKKTGNENLNQESGNDSLSGQTDRSVFTTNDFHALRKVKAVPILSIEGAYNSSVSTRASNRSIKRTAANLKKRLFPKKVPKSNE
mmetsp:Transcript_39323/g.47281  ORF Transcript_39323/g.47281 Transcript_39323/m.47281 type:complete len:146 (+) Transcript_39323:90-527(+)